MHGVLAVMRSNVYLISAAAALGGLLFGFDIAVINGALVFLRRQFQLSDLQTEVAASALLLGCVFGASLAGTLSDRFGRKRILLWSAMLFLVSSIGAALPRNLGEFTAARLLGGVAIGMESMLSPLYVAEISPARIRGRLVALNQLAIVVGILCAYLISWLLAGLGDASWRWMFASATLPSVLFVISFLRCPETPRWLIQQGRIGEARSVLTRVGSEGDTEYQIREIQDAIASEQEANRPIADLMPELLLDQRFQVRLVIHHQDPRGHADRSTRVSISPRSETKSIGLVNRASAPFSSAFFLVSASP